MGGEGECRRPVEETIPGERVGDARAQARAVVTCVGSWGLTWSGLFYKRENLY